MTTPRSGEVWLSATCCVMDFGFRIRAALWALALVPTMAGSDSGSPLRIVGSSGFCRNGVYSIMHWPGGVRPDGLQVWGSFCDRANDNVGRIESQYFLAPSVLNLYLAGYPGLPGRRLILRDVESGEERELAPQSTPREDWQAASLPVPPEWIGHWVQWVAEDHATGPFGWLGFSLPVLAASSLVSPIDTHAPQGGFCPDGVSDATQWLPGGPTKGAGTWGSFCKGGDADTGWAASPAFKAEPEIRLYLAGYPDTPGISLAVENTQQGLEFPLRVATPPGESWRLQQFRLPAGWKGQPVRVIARDEATGPHGWVAFSGLVPRSLTERAPDAAKALGLVLLLAVVLLLPAVAACLWAVLWGVEKVRYLAAIAWLTVGAGFGIYSGSRFWYRMDGIVSGCAGVLAMCAVGVYFGLTKGRGFTALRARLLTARGKRWLVLMLIWGAAALAILPAVFHWAAPPPYSGSDLNLPIGLGYCVALLICGCIFRAEVRRLSRSQAGALVFVVLLLTSITNNLHGFNVDHGKYIFTDLPNWMWQNRIHDLAIRLDPGLAPHSYRFLPNAIVRWMQMAHIDFESARDLYRLIAGLLLFYAIYKYARLFVNYSGAILAMVFTAMIYPVSFEGYGGQLTDPLSHLSFVLAFIFLETEEFALLLSTLVIGSLAKETVLAMTGYYVLFGRQEKRYVLKAAALCGVSVAVYFGVRVFVLHGAMTYHQTSGVGLEHVWENWRDVEWHTPFLLTACALLPFLAAGWKETPVSLKRQTLYLLPVLFLSSLFFSWLREARNFMPVVFVLAVIAAGYFSRSSAFTEDSMKDEVLRVGPQDVRGAQG